MKYFPILQELFESDTIIFLSIGVITAIIIGMQLKTLKSYIKGIFLSIIIYIACELLSNIHTNYMLEFVLLIVGTFTIGLYTGLLILFLIKLFKIKVKIR